MKLRELLGLAKVEFDKHSPEILTGMGVTGMFAAVIFSIRATPKAEKAVEEKKKELNKEKLTVGETIKTTWKYYIPTAITLAGSTACIIGANSVNTRRNAALAAAYTISETALQEYQDKVKEVVGESRESEVRSAVASDRVAANPPSQNVIIVSGKGDTLFMEALTGQYFKSDLEKVRKIENDLNREMRSSMTMSVNDVLCALGIRHNHKTYDYIGWDIDKSPIEFVTTPVIDDEMGVVVVIDYRYEPTSIV